MGSLVGLELDNGGVLLKFVKTAAETGGALHVQEARYSPHSGPPPYHCHPRQEERFSIVEGAMHFHVAGDDRIVRAGEEASIGKGVFHRMDNPHDDPAVVIWETRPALRSAEFFYAMSRARGGRARPRLVDALAILSEYREEIHLAKPSLVVQRIMFGCLAPFGRRALRPPMH
jgi:mannose-6-phosphate isomerase-like protein (cupin superfamily)